jgi:hypothetical protein
LVKERFNLALNLHRINTLQSLYTIFRFNLIKGWSEPTATNAPVEDEAIEAVLGMNQKYILPYPKLLVFSTTSLPQFFSLLPTSLPPTSPLLPPPTYLT